VQRAAWAEEALGGEEQVMRHGGLAWRDVARSGVLGEQRAGVGTGPAEWLVHVVRRAGARRGRAGVASQGRKHGRRARL
jgi:hypothetical protein